MKLDEICKEGSTGCVGVYDLDPHVINSVLSWMYCFAYGENLWVDITKVKFDLDFTIRVYVKLNDIPKLKSYVGKEANLVIDDRGIGLHEVIVCDPPVSDTDFTEFRRWRASLPWRTEMRTEVRFPNRDAQKRFERALALWQAGR